MLKHESAPAICFSSVSKKVKRALIYLLKIGLTESERSEMHKTSAIQETVIYWLPPMQLIMRTQCSTATL